MAQTLSHKYFGFQSDLTKRVLASHRLLVRVNDDTVMPCRRTLVPAVALRSG